MTFERPLFLWAFAALAPVAVAFLMRRRRPRVVVPDLEAWLAAAEGKRALAGWRTFRDKGSLLLNLAACAALALAAAGPRPAAPQGTDWALVFDVSASMSARDGRWEEALAGADAFVRGMTSNDRYRVYLAGERPRAVGGWRSAREALPDLPLPVERAGDVEGALALAAQDPGLRAGTLKTVAWSDRESKADFAPRISMESDNVAIEAIDAERAWGSAEVRIRLRVANYGRETVTPMIWASIGKDDVEIRWPTVPPAAPVTVEASVQSPEGGVLKVQLLHNPLGDSRVDARRHGLEIDDTAYAVVPSLRPPLVLIAAPESKSPFLASALLSLGKALDPESGIVAPGKEKGADLVVFDGCAPSGDPCVVIGAPGAAAEVENPAVTAWAADHPLLRGLDLSRLRVARARPLPRDPAATVLIDSAAGPLAAATADRVTLAFALEDSNLPLLAAFPLFVRNAVEALSRERPLPPAVTGDWLTPFEGEYDAWEAGATEPRSGPWRAERPGYAVFTRGGVSRPVAVNFFDPAESALGEPPPGRALPAPQPEPSPPWILLAAAAALLLAVDWALVAKR